MAAITVHVGKEEKEISGLTRKTTCKDVILALLTDKKADLQLLIEQGEEISSDDQDILNVLRLREVAKDYVIVENWRGCEKPLPRRTRILVVWQAWKDEQCHVKFSLKKDKSNRFRSSRHSKKEETRHRCGIVLDKSSVDLNGPPQYKISHDRKRQIRRSMQRFQQAVINQHSQEDIDGNNNAEKQLHHVGEPSLPGAVEQIISSGQKGRESPMVTLSEEQLVDGIVTETGCLLEDNLKSKFLRSAVNKGFNRERCNYRRPHHRRRSLLLEESDCVTDQNVVLTLPHKREFHHYPFCHNSRRRSNSKRRHRRHNRSQRDRASKRSRKVNQQGERCSTDSTASTGSVSLPSDVEVIAYSDGEDADDEKSVMAEYSRPMPGQKLSQFPGSLLACDERCCSGAGSASTATITDSSSSGNTTCSETSNTSGSSFTTSSSETSSSGDVESYFAKRDAAAAAAKANAVEKPKGGASKLLKPAHTLISSFKKKKKTPQVTVPGKTSSSTVSIYSKQTAKSCDLSSTKSAFLQLSQSNQTSKNQRLSSLNQQKLNKEIFKSCRSSNPLSKDEITRLNEQDGKEIEEIKKLILSRQQIIKSQQRTYQTTSSEIERLESQIQPSRFGLKENSHNQETPKTSSYQPIPDSSFSVTKWICDCQDANALEHYIASCERVVAKQLQIEENRRNADILLQKLRDEVWSAPKNIELPESNSISAVALGIIVGADENDSSDEEFDSRPNTLSVSSGKKKLEEKHEKFKKRDDQVGSLQVEKTRTELEANLYLGLRLSTELEEVEKLMSTSKQLLQIKGEGLLHLVRELAQSADGISPDLWVEYGDLLAAYDNEISLQRYLTACAKNDMVKHMQAECKEGFYDKNHLAEIVNDIESESTGDDALNHALSPWLWCEHCKEELQKSQKQGNFLFSGTPLSSSHWLSHTSVPLNFSALPLPNPPSIHDNYSETPNNSRLLPMPPVGLPENDSDLDEISKKDNSKTTLATSTIISTEDAVPKGMILHLPRTPTPQSQPISRPPLMTNLLPSSFRNSANTDDSGNASAESTASFASTSSDYTDLGSRNSSCDGGSPRPPSVTAESVDSAHSSPFLGRGNLKKNGGKSKFTFPSKVKKDPSITNRMEFMLKAIPTENHNLTEKGTKTIEENKSTNQAKKLIRRNSGKTKKTAPIISDSFARRAASFGKGSVKLPENFSNINGILKKPFVSNSHCGILEKSHKNKEKQEQGKNNIAKKEHSNISDIPQHPSPLYMRSHYPISKNHSSPTQATKFSPRNPNSHLSLPTLAETNSKNIAFDNDSDTGLGSLHSTESYDRLCSTAGETLV